MVTKECDSNGDCYYTFKDAWHVWGRWLFLGLLVTTVVLAVPFCAYLMSVKRVKNGLPPIPGFSWMFPNPYKNAVKAEDQRNLAQNEQRYRPRTELDDYREQKNAAFEQTASAASLSEEYSYPSSHNKFGEA